MDLELETISSSVAQSCEDFKLLISSVTCTEGLIIPCDRDHEG